MTKRTSLFANGLLWFGAAVSLAEIHTGTFFAPLGFAKGLLAIFLGHVIGCILLFLAGLIGAYTRKSAMQTVQLSFGRKGFLLFAVLNILQLVGWTGIMIFDGALAAGAVWGIPHWLWCVLIGGLIVLWIVIGLQNLGRLNTVAMAALFVLTVALSITLFRGTPAVFTESMSFGAAVELSVAMPLSWLPLISDYTREAERPLRATAVSALTYGLVSCWMYFIGMVAALFTGGTDLAQMLLKSGLGIAALLIAVLSTVTTTFLDAWSAGVSGESLCKCLQGKGKWIAVAAAVLGTVGAIFLPLTDITDFLYLIGSVFAPMVAILIADHFILKADHSQSVLNVPNLLVWVVGFVLYRLLMQEDIVVGSTLPDMLITMVLCIAVHRLWPCRNKQSK